MQAQTYEFSAKPSVIKPKTKYREQQYQEEDPYLSQHQNMMFDKKIVRGNTYAAIVTQKNTEQLKDTNKLVRSIKKPQNQQREIEVQQEYNEPGTPEPVLGRVHAGLQTDEFVETLTDKPPNYEKDTQTDFYIDRPLIRLFMPKKDGIDIETQIWDGDLFDFDYEVEPILQVLIGKTLEQSRMEVLEEEELRVMKDQQKRFEQLRNAELAEMQKLEAKERRIQQESENRKQQYQAKLDQNKLAHQKMVSRVLAKKYLNKLQPTVIEILKDQGVFRHPLDMTLLHQFLPWLYKEIGQELDQTQKTQQQIQELLTQGLQQNQQIHKDYLQKEKIRREEEIERRRLEQEAKEKRIAERKEAKRQKLEQERRQKLKEQVLEQLVAKGEQRPNILSLNIGDIDNHQADAPSIGLFGGLIGEYLLFLSSLIKLADEDEKYQALKDWLSSNENISTIFKELVLLICQEGSIELQIDSNVDKLLQELLGSEEEGSEPQNLQNWHFAPEEKLPEVYQLLKSNVSHLILNQIKQNVSEFNLPEDCTDECIMVLLKLIQAEEAIQQKVKWIKVEPKQNFDQVGICYMKPDLNTLQVNSRSERYGDQIEPQNEDEEPKPVVPINLAEADYENKQTLFVQQNEEIKVLTQHAVAELVVRDEILKSLSQQVSQVQGQEFTILMDSVDKMKQIQSTLLDKIQPDFPILDMDSY